MKEIHANALEKVNSKDMGDIISDKLEICSALINDIKIMEKADEKFKKSEVKTNE